jgi:hypothetical protein
VVLVSLPASQNFASYISQYPPFIADGVYASNIISKVMTSGAFNFGKYDLNHDNFLTVDELAIAIIVNDTNFGVGARSSPIVPLGTDLKWGYTSGGHPNVSIVKGDYRTIIFCEEFEETLGPKDIYGSDDLSMTLSPQSGGWWIDTDPLYYMDPWNRMELGWCQPRIASLTADGTATLPADQAGDPTGPVILYDPSRGTQEFFILEYRTHSTALYGTGYDANVADQKSDGLVIWHIQQDGGHNPTSVKSPVSANLTPAVWAETSPDLLPNANVDPVLWGNNSTTPNLSWIDGTQTLTTLHVRPFSPGANSITVDWSSGLEDDTWVDFKYSGSIQDGRFDSPFNTFAQGTNAVPYGGTLRLKTGSSSEKPNIAKPMHLKAYNGPVTIGH